MGGQVPACPCAGSATVPILPDDPPILPNLGVPVLLREGEAQIPGAVLIGGLILPGGRGADHGKLGHQVGFVWFLSILQHGRAGPCLPLCQLPDCHQTMGVPSLSVTVPASLSAAIDSRICRSSSPLAARFSRAEASSKVMIKCKTVWFELGCL